MRLACCVLAGLISGCSALLPHGESKVVSDWSTFDEAMAAFDAVVPYQTSEPDLEQLGFSPKRQANVQILNHADIAERFLLVSLNGSQLPPGLRDCMDRGGDCYAYEVKRRITRDRRYGNFFADFLNFKRKSVTRGWEFNALIVLIEDTVVYKLWSGTPDIHEYRDKTNPLGPLQGVGPALAPRPSL